MNSVQKFESFSNDLDKKSKFREIPKLLDEEYIFNPNYELNKYLETFLSIGKIIQIIPIDNDLQIVIEKNHGGRVYLQYNFKLDKFIDIQIKLTDKDKKTLEKIASEFNPKSRYNKVTEGVAEPTVKPTVKPGIKPSIGKPSPLRRDKPSVVPGPKAITDIDLANKFLNLTENNKEILSILKRKYNK